MSSMINLMKIKALKESSNLENLSLRAVLENLMKIQKTHVASMHKKTKIKSFKGFLKAIRSYWRKKETILPSKGATLRLQITFLTILSRVSHILNQSLLSSNKLVRTLSATKTLSYQAMTRHQHLTKTMLNPEQAKKIHTQLQNNSKLNRFRIARGM